MEHRRSFLGEDVKRHHMGLKLVMELNCTNRHLM